MAGNGEWNESIFDCTSDLFICFRGCCCPAGLFGSNAHEIDGSNCLLMCGLYCLLTHFSLCWVPHYMKRQAMRQKYGLREDPFDDCPVTCLCGPCALCQEARFLKNRGMATGTGPHTMQPRRNY